MPERNHQRTRICSVSTLGSGPRDMIYGKQKAGEIDRNYATDKIRPLRRLRIQQAGISSDNYKLCQVVRSPGEDKLNRHLFLRAFSPLVRPPRHFLMNSSCSCGKYRCKSSPASGTGQKEFLPESRVFETRITRCILLSTSRKNCPKTRSLSSNCNQLSSSYFISFLDLDDTYN